MPHIVVEHTKDVATAIDIKELNASLHDCLATQETVKIQSVKTRSIQVENAFVGDGSKKDFVHINVMLLAGRSEELKQTMAENLFKEAQNHLSDVNCPLSVNVDELGTYQK